MRKFLLLLVPFLLFASENYNGYKDTASITGTLVDGTKQYTTAYDLSDGHDLWIINMVDDSAEAGFANDSVYYEWGVQVGHWCLDSATTADTCWEQHIVVDSITVDSFGVSRNSTMANDGAVTRTLNGADTSNVPGYAYQCRKIDLDDVWGNFVRGWVNSLGDPSKDGAGLEIRFHFIQRKRFK